MNESEVSKKIGDVISLLQLLEAVSSRFADPQLETQGDRNCEVPWPGIKITLSSAKRILEEALVFLSMDTQIGGQMLGGQLGVREQTGPANSESDNAMSEESYSKLIDFTTGGLIDVTAEGEDYGFSPPASLAGRIRRVPIGSDFGVFDSSGEEPFSDRKSSTGGRQDLPNYGNTTKYGSVSKFSDGSFREEEVFKVREITPHNTSRGSERDNLNRDRDSSLATDRIENLKDKTPIGRT